MNIQNLCKKFKQHLICRFQKVKMEAFISNKFYGNRCFAVPVVEFSKKTYS